MDLTRLDREINALRNTLRSNLVTRKAHPTYGITKADLRENFQRLEGMLMARAVLRAGDRSIYPAAHTHTEALEVGFDLAALWTRVKEA